MNFTERMQGGPCEGCTDDDIVDSTTAANRNPFLGPPLDFVYLYIHSKVDGEELRFSIRSVLKNYVGAARIWIVGDRPSWYHGLHIPLSRIRSSKGRARLDRAKKLYHIATQAPQINDRFVAMQDDIYFVDKVTYYDLNRRWVNDRPLTPEWVCQWKPKDGYSKQKRATALKLFANGIYYVSDYSTHTPKLYYKDDLKTVIETYNALEEPLVCTVLFDNAILRTDRPFPIQPYRVRLRTQDHTSESLQKSCQGKIFLNHICKSWTPGTRDALEAMFPDPSILEQS